MAPYGTDTRQTFREAFVEREPSPELDRQLHADHNSALDTCTHPRAPRQAGSERILNG